MLFENTDQYSSIGKPEAGDCHRLRLIVGDS